MLSFTLRFGLYIMTGIPFRILINNSTINSVFTRNLRHDSTQYRTFGSVLAEELRSRGRGGVWKGPSEH